MWPPRLPRMAGPSAGFQRAGRLRTASVVQWISACVPGIAATLFPPDGGVAIVDLE